MKKIPGLYIRRATVSVHIWQNSSFFFLQVVSNKVRSDQTTRCCTKQKKKQLIFTMEKKATTSNSLKSQLSVDRVMQLAKWKGRNTTDSIPCLKTSSLGKGKKNQKKKTAAVPNIKKTPCSLCRQGTGDVVGEEVGLTGNRGPFHLCLFPMQQLTFTQWDATVKVREREGERAWGRS